MPPLPRKWSPCLLQKFDSSWPLLFLARTSSQVGFKSAMLCHDAATTQVVTHRPTDSSWSLSCPALIVPHA